MRAEVVDECGWHEHTTSRKTSSAEVADECGWHEHVTSRKTSRRLPALAFFAAVGLLVAMVTGLVVGIRTTRESDTGRDELACDAVRDHISGWGIGLSARAHNLGSMMKAQNTTGLPFLDPYKGGVYQLVAESMRYAKTLYSEGDVRVLHASPLMSWAPTVAHADRALFEYEMSSLYGFGVGIYDLAYIGGTGQNLEFATAQYAPERSSYTPAAAAWNVFDTGSGITLSEHIGVDVGHRWLGALPTPLSHRLFDERRVIAHAPFTATGHCVIDAAILVKVPYSANDKASAAIDGFVHFALESAFWEGLFPAHVELLAFTGEKIKSVEAKVRKAAVVVQEHEPHLDLEIRCYYQRRSVFQTAGPYLAIGAIGLLLSVVALSLTHVLNVRMQDTHTRSAWAWRQLRILNTTLDAIVNVTLSEHEEPKMDILNPGGDHELRSSVAAASSRDPGARRTRVVRVLSDMVSAEDLARVRTQLENPASRTIEFTCSSGVPFEVAVSPLLESERICVFRDCSDRIEREKSSLRAARAEGSLIENEKTEKYVSHELKNRLIVLEEIVTSCSADATELRLPDVLQARHASMIALVDEILEMTRLKSVMFHLVTGVYSARLEDADISGLLATRVERYVDAGRAVALPPMGGTAAAHGMSLLLDPMLINIILDNLLSNALKYGGAERPPSASLKIEHVEEGVVSVSLVVRNAAGTMHAKLLKLGEDELNRIAATEGERAHGEHGASSSEGNGFPMAVASATALGGTLRLEISQVEVCARLSLPRVGLYTTAYFGAMEISELSMALVDDSKPARKMLKRKIKNAFASCLVPIVAGETHASIESFPTSVIDADVDVLFVDQNFGDAHQTKVGTDLVREIRALDLEAGNPSRLIFVVSANDSPEDITLYLAAGADGHNSRAIAPAALRALICQCAMQSAGFRFRGRISG